MRVETSTTESTTLDEAEAPNFWATFNEAMVAAETAETPAEMGIAFWRAAMLLASTALALHPEARNYLAGTVVDEASLRTATITASWDDGVSPLRRLAILEHEITKISLACKDNVGASALAALNRSRIKATAELPDVDVQLEQLRSLVEQLGRVSASDAPRIVDQIAVLRDRLPSSGPVVDLLVGELVRAARSDAPGEARS